MARDTYLVTPDRPFIHRTIEGSGDLKAGTVIDANDVVDQIVTLAGAFRRIRIYFKAAVAGSLTVSLMRPGGNAANLYGSGTPAKTAAITANVEAVVEFDETEFFGESQAFIEFTGDAGIVTPAPITYADICGV